MGRDVDSRAVCWRRGVCTRSRGGRIATSFLTRRVRIVFRACLCTYFEVFMTSVLPPFYPFIGPFLPALHSRWTLRRPGIDGSCRSSTPPSRSATDASRNTSELLTVPLLSLSLSLLLNKPHRTRLPQRRAGYCKQHENSRTSNMYICMHTVRAPCAP